VHLPPQAGPHLAGSQERRVLTPQLPFATDCFGEGYLPA
jgi:hypothetical protein